MKNKILLASLIAASALTFSTSAKADNTGCGLGSMIFKGTSNVITDILAVTLCRTGLQTVQRKV